MHIVLRSSQATGRRSFLHHKNRKHVGGIVIRQAKIASIKIKHYENVGNHLHIVVRVAHRKALFRFLRAISGLIARAVMGCEKGQPLREAFWDARPFSRIVDWGRRSLQALTEYIRKNRTQALGYTVAGKLRLEFESG
jgi:REP element-mobilizing transposase RayT